MGFNKKLKNYELRWVIVIGRKRTLNKIPNRTMTDTNTRMMIKFGPRDNVCLTVDYHRNVLIAGYSTREVISFLRYLSSS